jgi:hypothetical protein
MVLKSARLQLASIRPNAEKLNTASDHFTQELETIESELGELSLGLEVTLEQPLTYGDLTEDRDDEGVRPPIQSRLNNYLGYGRYRGSWRLLVRTFRDYEDRGGNLERSVLEQETSLMDSSRDLRIAAAEQIESLLQAIAKGAQVRLESLSKVIDKK